MGQVKGGQSRATVEHELHGFHLGGVELGQVKGGQS